ncbi:MAG: hypothetical protein WCW52_04820 [Elusimicrobiales bacterium]|jgi:hypothetical protein
MDRITKTSRTMLEKLVALFMPGCATERVMAMGKRYPPTSVATVKILQTGRPVAPYVEIGIVSVDKYSALAANRPKDKVYNFLREKAAAIGGDAVIITAENDISASGLVIKLKSGIK